MQKFREAVFQLLYSYDLGEAQEEAMVRLIMEELAITKKIALQAQERASKVRAKLSEIDKLIAETSISYEFERIQSVERNVIRLGLYELLFDDEIPPKVAISEALRLARKFGTKEAAFFVNAILDVHYKKSLGEKPDNTLLERSAQELAESERITLEAALAPKKNPEDQKETP
jgi:N utilization substance protein B